MASISTVQGAVGGPGGFDADATRRGAGRTVASSTIASSLALLGVFGSRFICKPLGRMGAWHDTHMAIHRRRVG
jgi:hypothetical protein